MWLGGGGGGCTSEPPAGAGGVGGGTNGGVGELNSNGYTRGGNGGTQTSGGAVCTVWNGQTGNAGGFGYGGSGGTANYIGGGRWRLVWRWGWTIFRRRTVVLAMLEG